MRRVTAGDTKTDYVLVLTFDEGTQGELSIADRLFGPMFEPLRDPDYFAKARANEFGAVCWPHEADLAPDTLYRSIPSY